MIRAGELQGARIVDERGRHIGRVAELHLKEGQLESLAYGAGGALQRFWPWRGGGKIAWTDVVEAQIGRVTVRKTKPGGDAE